MRQSKEEAGNLLPQAFTFNATNRTIRAQMVNNQPFFIAKDICDALELLQVSKAVQALDEDEKLMGKLFLSGQHRDTWLINESGLYNLIFRSNKPEAKAFRKWVTAEVLPAIRMNGSYGTPRKLTPIQPIGSYIDARDKAYDTVTLDGKAIRRISVDDKDFYSINDIQRAMCASTSASQIADKLNARQQLAIKIFVYGNTHPAWFCTRTGMQLVLAGGRVLKGRQLILKEEAAL